MEIFPEDFYNDQSKVKIKPKLIAKIPFKWYANSIDAIDLFIDMSPGLMHFKKRDCLIVIVKSQSTMFMTDCERCLREYEDKFTENVAICNLKLFAEEYDKKEQKREQAMDMFDDRDSGVKPGMEQHASNILRLLKGRQQPPPEK